MVAMRLIDNWKRELHRLWVIRASLAFAAFTAVSGGIGFLAGVLDPWLLIGLSVVFNVACVPLARLAKQDDAP